jgi:hypothetical protein
MAAFLGDRSPIAEAFVWDGDFLAELGAGGDGDLLFLAINCGDFLFAPEDGV